MLGGVPGAANKAQRSGQWVRWQALPRRVRWRAAPSAQALRIRQARDLRARCRTTTSASRTPARKLIVTMPEGILFEHRQWPRIRARCRPTCGRWRGNLHGKYPTPTTQRAWPHRQLPQRRLTTKDLSTRRAQAVAGVLLQEGWHRAAVRSKSVARGRKRHRPRTSAPDGRAPEPPGSRSNHQPRADRDRTVPSRRGRGSFSRTFPVLPPASGLARRRASHLDKRSARWFILLDQIGENHAFQTHRGEKPSQLGGAARSKQLILRAILRPGERLPSEREHEASAH